MAEKQDSAVGGKQTHPLTLEPTLQTFLTPGDQPSSIVGEHVAEKLVSIETENTDFKNS